MSATTTQEAGMAEATEEQAAQAAANGEGEDAERRTLEQLAQDDPDEAQEAEQFTLFGTAPRLNGSISGTKVNTSHVKFKARQQDVPGQFGMGEIVELRVLARVDKVEFSSKHDGDGNVMSTKRIHQLNALSVEQIGDVPDEFAEVDGRMEAMTE